MHSVKAYHAPANDSTPMHTQLALSEISGIFFKRAYEKFLASALICKGSFLRESYFQIMNYKPPMMNRRRRITLSQIGTHYQLSKTEQSTLKRHKHEQQKQTKQVVFIYLCVQHRCTIHLDIHIYLYVYVRVTIIVKEKEVVNLTIGRDIERV